MLKHDLAKFVILTERLCIGYGILSFYSEAFDVMDIAIPIRTICRIGTGIRAGAY